MIPDSAVPWSKTSSYDMESRQLFLDVPCLHAVSVSENGIKTAFIGGAHLMLDLSLNGNKALLCGPDGAVEISIKPSRKTEYSIDRILVGISRKKKMPDGLVVGEIFPEQDGKNALLSFLSHPEKFNEYSSGSFSVVFDHLESFIHKIALSKNLYRKPPDFIDEAEILKKRDDFEPKKDFSALYNESWLDFSTSRIIDHVR